MKKELLASAPWREEQKPPEEFSEAKMKVTRRQPGKESTMHVPLKRSVSSKRTSSGDDKASHAELDPEVSYSFQRNVQFLKRVFTIDTLVKPLPPPLAFHASRSLSFFTRIFTQFWDPKGITAAQKSLGLGQEEKVRRVR